MADVLRFPGHHWYSCPPGEARCSEGRCMFCEGGLSLCTVCRCGEAELATECPGRRLEEAERAAICNGHLDFVGGGWVCVSTEAKIPLAPP